MNPFASVMKPLPVQCNLDAEPSRQMGRFSSQPAEATTSCIPSVPPSTQKVNPPEDQMNSSHLHDRLRLDSRRLPVSLCAALAFAMCLCLVTCPDTRV